MIEAKSLGLTKSIGVSNFNEEQINRLLDHGLEKPAALQVEVGFYSMGGFDWVKQKTLLFHKHTQTGV